ncbi:MAG: hypothetical protein VW238_00820 [Nitrosomonadales bacterium]
MKINLHINQPNSLFLKEITNNLNHYHINPIKLDFFQHLNSLLAEAEETIIHLFLNEDIKHEYLYCYVVKPALFDLHIDSFSFKDEITLETKELKNLINLFNNYLSKSFKFVLSNEKMFLLTKFPLNLNYGSLFDLTFNPKVISIKNKSKDISQFLNNISMLIHEYNSKVSNQNKFNNLIFINGGKISEKYIDRLSNFYFNNFFLKNTKKKFNQIESLVQTNNNFKLINFVLDNPSFNDYQIIKKHLKDINQVYFFGNNASYKLDKQHPFLKLIYKLTNRVNINEIEL